MLPLLSEAYALSLASIVVALIAAVPATLAAYWSRAAKADSKEAKENSAEAKTNSEEARNNSANALHEVQTNGGMSDPKPNLNDHVKYQTTMTEWLVRTVQDIDTKFNAHLKHSQVMDQALAEVYMEVRPAPREWPDEPLPQPPTD